MSRAYLKSLVSCWTKQLEAAKERKAADFGKTARTLWGFMTKSYRQLYIEKSEEMDDRLLAMPSPEQQAGYYKPRIMKCREFVNVVLPFVHAQLPGRIVAPARPPLPGQLVDLVEAASQLDPAVLPTELLLLQAAAADQAQWSPTERIVCWLMQWYLNYVVREYDANAEQRTAIEEALVKGRGIVWHGMSEGPAGLIPASYFDTVDGLFIDPDARQWRDAGYIFREQTWPAWRLADVFGIDEDKLRAAQRGGDEKTITPAAPQAADEVSDECTWFEVWSRIGTGARLWHAGETLRDAEQARADALDQVGHYVYLAVLPGLDYPLNVTPELWETGTAGAIAAELRWPIPFHDDRTNPFPCTRLDFYPNVDNPWATSPLYPGISQQVFLDHVYSFLMTRLRTTSRDIIITAKMLEEAVRRAIAQGLDQVVVAAETDQVAEIDKLVHILQFPTLNNDMWRVLEYVERSFEMATGLDPFLYGSQPQRQIRSSHESQVRELHLSNRPRDMADAVRNWSSQIAKAEGQLTRMYVRPRHVAPLFREPVTDDPVQYGPLSALWAAMVNTDDPGEAVADLHYTVEASGGRPKNKQTQMQNLQMIGQNIQPMLEAYAARGINAPWNNFMDILAEVYEIPLDRLKLPEFQPAEEQEGGAAQGQGA